MNHIDAHKTEFQLVLDHFHKELQGLRTGRASVALVENIRVNVYGQMMELKATASLMIPDAKTIQIEPWDKAIVKDVEKALIEASLGMMPNTAGTVIRLSLPPMTEDGRKSLVKMVGQKLEIARVSIRNVREKIKHQINAEEKAKTMPESESRRLLEQLDKVVKEWNEKVEKLATEKQQEIMTV